MMQKQATDEVLLLLRNSWNNGDTWGLPGGNREPVDSASHVRLTRAHWSQRMRSAMHFTSCLPSHKTLLCTAFSRCPSTGSPLQTASREAVEELGTLPPFTVTGVATVVRGKVQRKMFFGERGRVQLRWSAFTDPYPPRPCADGSEALCSARLRCPARCRVELCAQTELRAQCLDVGASVAYFSFARPRPQSARVTGSAVAAGRRTVCRLGSPTLTLVRRTASRCAHSCPIGTQTHYPPADPGTRCRQIRAQEEGRQVAPPSRRQNLLQRALGSLCFF